MFEILVKKYVYLKINFIYKKTRNEILHDLLASRNLPRSYFCFNSGFKCYFIELKDVFLNGLLPIFYM